MTQFNKTVFCFFISILSISTMAGDCYGTLFNYFVKNQDDLKTIDGKVSKAKFQMRSQLRIDTRFKRIKKDFPDLLNKQALLIAELPFKKECELGICDNLSIARQVEILIDAGISYDDIRHLILSGYTYKTDNILPYTRFIQRLEFHPAISSDSPRYFDLAPTYNQVERAKEMIDLYRERPEVLFEYIQNKATKLSDMTIVKDLTEDDTSGGSYNAGVYWIEKKNSDDRVVKLSTNDSWEGNLLEDKDFLDYVIIHEGLSKLGIVPKLYGLHLDESLASFSKAVGIGQSFNPPRVGIEMEMMEKGSAIFKGTEFDQNVMNLLKDWSLQDVEFAALQMKSHENILLALDISSQDTQFFITPDKEVYLADLDLYTFVDESKGSQRVSFNADIFNFVRTWERASGLEFPRYRLEEIFHMRHSIKYDNPVDDLRINSRKAREARLEHKIKEKELIQAIKNKIRNDFLENSEDVFNTIEKFNIKNKIPLDNESLWELLYLANGSLARLKEMLYSGQIHKFTELARKERK